MTCDKVMLSLQIPMLPLQQGADRETFAQAIRAGDRPTEPRDDEAGRPTPCGGKGPVPRATKDPRDSFPSTEHPGSFDSEKNIKRQRETGRPVVYTPAARRPARQGEDAKALSCSREAVFLARSVGTP